MDELLVAENLHVYYGAVRALEGVSLRVFAQDIVAVLGANGAGKTTLLKSISGLVPIAQGSIVFAGQSLNGLPAHLVSLRGITHVPEGRRIFATLTVEENLKLGGYGRPRPQVAQAKEKVFALFPILRERRRQLAGTLSGGEQQMLAIGRGLMREPKILLLDEPSLGLAPLLVEQVFRTIQEINAQARVPILLVEQNARKALNIAQRAYILETGKLVMEGAAAELKQDDRVRRAYLGGTAMEG